MINRVLEAIKHKWDSTPRRDLVKEVTAFTVADFATNKLLVTSMNTLSSARAKVLEVTIKIEKGTKTEEGVVILLQKVCLSRVRVADEGTSSFSEKAE